MVEGHGCTQSNNNNSPDSHHISMPDIGDITGRIALDMSDTLSQLAGLSSAIETAFQPPDAGPITGAIADIGSSSVQTGSAVDDLGARVAALMGSGEAATMAEALAIALGTLGENAGAAAGTIPGVGDALDGIGSSAGSAAEQLNLFDQSIAVPYADAAGQLNLFGDAIEVVSGDATSAATAVDALKGAVEGAGGAAGAGADGEKQFSDAAQAIIDKQRELDAELATAQGALTEIQAAYDAGKASADDLARATAGVESATKAVNPALAESGTHAHEGASAFGEMAEKLTAVAEALVITKGLEQLGEAALAAADAVTRASIALTAITGSAGEAKDVIEGLDRLGTSDGLSLPSLYTAGTRMQQLLGPGADVVGILGKIADGAAVMGTDINAAATKFDTLATGGNASARTMLSLGLNMQTLSAAINVVNPALDTTADSAKKAFKELDQADRIAVLEQALGTLGGTAQKVADQTFGGEWQRLENQWEQTMAQVGQMLMPIISDITDFANQVLEVVKQVAGAFNQLPGPVKEVAGAIAILVAAVVPVAGALAGISLAMSGLSGLTTAATAGWTALTGLFGEAGVAAAVATPEVAALGIAAEVAAPEVAALGAVEAATGIGAVGAAAVAAIPEIVGIGSAAVASEAGIAILGLGLGEILIPLGLLAGAIALVVWGPLGDGAVAVAGTVDDATRRIWADGDLIRDTADKVVESALRINEAVISIKVTDFAGPTPAQIQQYQALNDIAAKTGRTFDEVRTLMEEMAKQGGTDLNTVLGITVEKTASLGAQSEKLIDHQRQLVENLDKAKASLKELQAAMDAGTVSSKGYAITQEDIAAAQLKVDSATKALTSSLASHLPIVTQVFTATKAWVETATAAISPIKALSDVAAAQQIKVDQLTISLGNVQKALEKAITDEQNAKAAWDGTTKGLGALEQAQAAVAKEAGILNTVQTQLNAAIDAAQKSFDKASGAVNAFALEQAKARGAMDIYNIQLQNMGIFAAASAPQMTPLNQAISDLKVKTDATHPSLTTLQTDMGNLLQAAKDGKITWDQFTQGQEAFDKQVAQIGKVDLPAATAAIGANTAAAIAGHAPASIIATDMAAYQSSIDKLAKTSLPDAITQQGIYTQLLIAEKAPLGQILDSQAKQIQDQITLAEQTGTSASSMILSFEGVRLKQEALKASADGLAPAYVSAINDVKSSLNSLGQSFANNLVDQKNWSDVGTKLLDDFAKKILNDVVKAAMQPFETELNKLISSLLPAVGGALNTTSGSIAGLSASAAASASAMKAQHDAVMATVDADQGLTSSLGDVTANVKTSGASFNGLVNGIGLAGVAMGVLSVAAMALSVALEPKASAAQQGSFFAGAGLTPETLKNLSNTLGVNFATPEVLASLGQLTGLAQVGNATAAQIAASVTKQTAILDAYKTQQGALQQEMIAAISAGNYTLSNEIWDQLKIVGGNITAATAVLDLINASAATGASTAAQLNAQFATNSANIEAAQREGNTSLVASLTAANAVITQQLAALNTTTAAVATSTGSSAASAASIAPQIAALNAQFAANTTAIHAAAIEGNTTLVATLVAANAGITQQIAALQATTQSTGAAAQTTGAAAQATAVNQAATTVQMFSALTDANIHLTDLKTQQASLNDQLIKAEAAGNTSLVTSLTGQLATVSTAISTQATLLSGITTAVQTISPGIVTAFNTLQQALTTSTPEVIAAVQALETAIGTGDIAAITKATADLHAAIVAATQSPAVTAAIKEMQDALLSGDTAAIQKATTDLTTAEKGNTDALAAAEKAVGDAIISGDSAALTKGLTDLQNALTAKSTADTAAQITAMGGVKASADQIKAAIDGAKATLEGLTTLQSQLNQDLIVALADGDTKLAASIEAELAAVGGQITTATSAITQLQTITGTGSANVVTGLLGVKASDDQIAQAVANAQGAVDALNKQLTGLNQQLIIAEAAGNTTLVNTLIGQISGVNTQLGTANSTLTQISANTGPTVAPGAIMSPAERDALNNAKQALAALQAQQTALNQQLIAAEAANNQASVAYLQGLLSTLNGQISSAQSFVDQLVAAINANQGAIKALEDKLAANSAAQIAAGLLGNQALVNQLKQDAAKLQSQIDALEAPGAFASPPPPPITPLTAEQIAAALAAQVAAMGSAQASPAQIATAIANLTVTIAGENAHQAQLNNDLRIALAAGNTALANAILAQLSTLNGQISTDQATLAALKGEGKTGTSGSGGSSTTPAGQTAAEIAAAALAAQIAAMGGVQASAAQIAAAIAHMTDVVNGEVAKQTALNNDLRVALSTGNTTLAAGIQAQLSTLNSQLSADQATLAALKGPAAVVTPPLTAEQIAAALAAQIKAMGGVQATPEQIATAIAKMTDVVNGEVAKQTELSNDLRVALSQGNATLAAGIQSQLSALNSQLSADQATLAALKGPAGVASPSADIAKLTAAIQVDQDKLVAAIMSGKDSAIASASQQYAIDEAQLKVLQASQALAAAQALGTDSSAQLAALQAQVSIAKASLDVAQRTGDLAALIASNAPPDQIAAMRQDLAVANATLVVATDTQKLTDAIATNQLPAQLSVLEQQLQTDKDTLAKLGTGTSTAPAGAVKDAQATVATDQANLLAAVVANSPASVIAALQAQYTLDEQLLVIAQNQDALAQAQASGTPIQIALAQQQLAIGQDNLAILTDTNAIEAAKRVHAPADLIAGLTSLLRIANDQLAVDQATRALTDAIANGALPSALSVLEKTLATAQANLKTAQTVPPPPPPAVDANAFSFSGYNPYTTPIVPKAVSAPIVTDPNTGISIQNVATAVDTGAAKQVNAIAVVASAIDTGTSQQIAAIAVVSAADKAAADKAATAAAAALTDSQTRAAAAQVAADKASALSIATRLDIQQGSASIVNAIAGESAAVTASLAALSSGIHADMVSLKAALSGALPSLDMGSGILPHDMVAQLHRGEVVLTADEVRAGMAVGAGSYGGALSPSSGGGSASPGGPITININGSHQSPRQIAAEVMDELRRVSPKFSPRSI